MAAAARSVLSPALACGFVVALPACASAPPREVQSPRDAVTELRAALAQMSDDEGAPAARLELERARGYLAEADAALTKEAEPQAVALLIELSRGQLVVVKSVIERRKAEAALAQKSDEYRKAREALDTVQRDAKALDPASGGAP